MKSIRATISQLALAAAILCLPLAAMAQLPEPWLHIISGSDFTSLKISEVGPITHTGNDWEAKVVINGQERYFYEVDRFEIGTNVPLISITLTEHGDWGDLADKETYQAAVLDADGCGWHENVAGASLSIKGRGNSTWMYPKKPYRLKFDKKTALLGFPKQKNYALIANYIDCTLLRNAIALKAAQLLGMPYTNHAQPVRLVFNGIDKGAYMLTEKIGISQTSVDIDEATGMLFELDENFDEPYKFWSEAYSLPVMVKDPDLDEVAAAAGTTPQELLQQWADDFNAFEAKAMAGEAVDGVDIDLASLVDYLIVYNFALNMEVRRPKSVFLYKRSLDDAYHFGPVWDFDWAFTYMGEGNIEGSWPKSVLFNQGHNGSKFFITLCKLPGFQEMYAARWQQFVDEMLPELYEYMDSYAELIRPSAYANGMLWPAQEGVTLGTANFDANVSTLKQWIETRVDYISSHKNHGLYH